jgi:hypothetical protein
VNRRVNILTCVLLVTCAVLVLLYEISLESELVEVRSPDGRTAISFWSHPDLIGGVTRVAVSRKGRTDYLYTVDSDSCSAPRDPRVLEHGRERSGNLPV